MTTLPSKLADINNQILLQQDMQHESPTGTLETCPAVNAGAMCSQEQPGSGWHALHTSSTDVVVKVHA